MLTVLEAIKLSTEYLEKKGIESARTNAELLLAHILNCSRLDLYLKFDQPLKQNETDQYREYIARRGKYEPLQYITGTVDFFGLRLNVDSSVLIPRPETELLVEIIIEQYKEIPNTKILDIGTGSGNIAIALAKYLENSSVVSIDVNDSALDTAKQNAGLNDVHNVEFIQKDILNNVDFRGIVFDLIVSNPPYVSSEEYEQLQKEITEYEPRNAVTDSEDGLKFYKKISGFASKNLTSGGKLFFEIGIGQSQAVADILRENGFTEIQIQKDYQLIDRIIYGIKQ
ncbi:MAG: peptide chain release factor N(5)-glutamine methyltransferase [Ignavibacteriales bacterium]|nr:peptide chain release factor N(5)-glutamine methyltransferase [Ignavibacteriales bacterium]